MLKSIFIFCTGSKTGERMDRWGLSVERHLNVHRDRKWSWHNCKNKTKWKIMSLSVLSSCWLLPEILPGRDAALKCRANSERDEIHISSGIIRYAHRGHSGAEMGSRMSAVHEVYRKANMLATRWEIKASQAARPRRAKQSPHGRRHEDTQRPTWITWRLLWLISHGIMDEKSQICAQKTGMILLLWLNDHGKEELHCSLWQLDK